MYVFKEIESKFESQMKKTVDKMREELMTIRTGRANPAILDTIKVECYGSVMPINQLATVGVPEPKTIEIRPWDMHSIRDIEKAILKSQLGLNPINDGKVIRLPIPPLTEETRKNLVKYIKQIEEQHKVSLRNARREAIEQLKASEKNKIISEDQRFKAEEETQKLSEKYIKILEDMIKNKEKEIMEV